MTTIGAGRVVTRFMKLKGEKKMKVKAAAPTTSIATKTTAMMIAFSSLLIPLAGGRV